MATSKVVIFAIALAVAGLILNDWLPTGILKNVGSIGNTDRRDALRGLSIVLPLLGVLMIVWRQWIANNLASLVVLFVSTIVSITLFVGADIVLSKRVVKAQSHVRQIANVHVADDLLGWRPGANMRGSHEEDNSFSVEYEIDAAGFKAVANSGQPSTRIYIFGDSYTFGHGVENVDTYANIIADEYLAPNIHVHNVGVMGYGVVQIFGRFLELERQLKPGDIVIFAPTSQDLKRNLQDYVFPAKLIFGERTEFGSRYPRYHQGRLRSTELLTRWNTTKALLFNGRWTKKIFRFAHSAIVSPPTTREAAEMFDRAATLTSARGAKFLLVFLPQTKERLHNAYEEDVSIFDFEDLMAYFPQAAPELAALRFKTDSHWNRRGHEVAADALVSTLLKRRFILPEQFRHPNIVDRLAESRSSSKP
jgi:hypothetical protein